MLVECVGLITTVVMEGICEYTEAKMISVAEQVNFRTEQQEKNFGDFLKNQQS